MSKYDLDMDSLNDMMQALTAGWSLMKFEIIRDFFQIISLFCTSFIDADAYKGVMEFFGTLGGIISLDLKFFDVNLGLNLDIGEKFDLFLNITGVIFSGLTFFYVRKMKQNMPDEIRGGDEHKAWGEMNKNLVRNIKIVLNLCLFF